MKQAVQLCMHYHG